MPVPVAAHERAGRALLALSRLDLRVGRDESAGLAVRLVAARGLAVLEQVQPLVLVVAAERAGPRLHFRVGGDEGAGAAQRLRIAGFDPVVVLVLILVGAATRAGADLCVFRFPHKFPVFNFQFPISTYSISQSQNPLKSAHTKSQHVPPRSSLG